MVFIFIAKPKMRRIGPRREHVRLDDIEIIGALDKFLEKRPRSQALCPSSQLDFSENFRHLMVCLGLPTRQGDGYTPASLRPGGATHWYQLTDSPDHVRFKGRWSNSRMLEIYIQEVAASAFLSTQPEPIQQRVHTFAAAAPHLLASFAGADNMPSA